MLHEKNKVRFILRHFSLANVTLNMENHKHYRTNER